MLSWAGGMSSAEVHITQPQRQPIIDDDKIHTCNNILLNIRFIQFVGKMIKLDRGSIMSRPRYGLSTPYRLTIRNSAGLFYHLLFNMGALHLGLPALNLSTLNADILIIMQQED